ncbi:DUF1963 domain-containing protein [Streptomyces sp. NPDC006670]|uniref:DUF1963 domain-containing protein n=1 Tax=Streptomyces sp. NPDC006670 TaxID=3154476 RepID=UPI0033F2A5DD
MTTMLMTYAGPAEPDALVTRTGGTPLAPAGTSWPTCGVCGGPMQFLAQILLDSQSEADGVMAIFMCQNDPGMCDEWSPTSGGNRALIFPATSLQPIAAPECEDEDALHLGAVNAVTLTASPSADYSSAREQKVLGQLGGRPAWLQYDETPDCSTCTRPMRLIAQLEEGPHPSTSMNFGGGGSAYAFACAPCSQTAFLWQC